MKLSKYLKKEWKEEKRVKFSNIMMGLGIGLFFISFYMFYAGFHNVDLSWNVLKISYYGNLVFEDFVDMYNTNGDTISYDMGYILGLRQMEIGFYSAILGGLCFAYALTIYYLLIKKELKEKR